MDARTAPAARLTAFGIELINIHRWLREELARLGAGVDAYLDGRGERPPDLKAHCLSFCSALTEHHTGEDSGAFPLLAQLSPELRPVLAKLAEDHQMVRSILRDLERLIAGMTAEPDAAEASLVRGELGGLTAILESHFAFEERRIVAALNALPAEAGTAESLLGMSASDRR
jgi:iron-sulfur cluster repair protein YtfE (RIC family)